MLDPLFDRAAPEVIAVSELNRRAAALLGNSFPPLWVSGEISNLTRHASGHWYFCLKDARAQVRCVMFKHRNQYIDFTPREGMQVEARVLVSLYEARGEFQLNVETLRLGGLGALYEAFAKNKTRLEAEGLFASERKRALPPYPTQIGIITSSQAAALRDVLTTLRRRMPGLPVVIYPTPVQGKGAHVSIVRALSRANQRAECDVLILCRGGGSIEDLWEFNEEAVVRALVASRIPVICGIGHETDFTLADFAADQRAPTPTAAAELASPTREDLRRRLQGLRLRMQRQIQTSIEHRMQHLDHLAKRLQHPGRRLQLQSLRLCAIAQRLPLLMQQTLNSRKAHCAQASKNLYAALPSFTQWRQYQIQLARRLNLASSHQVSQAANRVAHLSQNLAHLNPQATLARGYSVVRNARGEIVRDSATLQVGECLALRFAQGSAETQVSALAPPNATPTNVALASAARPNTGRPRTEES